MAANSELWSLSDLSWGPEECYSQNRFSSPHQNKDRPKDSTVPQNPRPSGLGWGFRASYSLTGGGARAPALPGLQLSEAGPETHQAGERLAGSRRLRLGPGGFVQAGPCR